ncbi:MAG: hypothetical protein ACUVTO_01035 [Candidatus Caldatribacteriaceae bacterium]
MVYKVHSYGDLCGSCSHFLSPMAVALGLGEENPSFRVVTGDGITLEKLDLLGSVGVIFYEDRQSVEINSSLKYALGNLVESNRDRYGVVRFVQIVDASSANFLTRTIWKRMLPKKSGSRDSHLCRLERLFGRQARISSENV